jgi:hypothetical protein
MRADVAWGTPDHGGSRRPPRRFIPEQATRLSRCAVAFYAPTMTASLRRDRWVPFKGLSLLRMASADKLVPSPLLNRAGAQVVRMVAAHALHRVARRRAPKQLEQWCATLDAEGLLVIPDFLSKESFLDLRARARRLVDDESIGRKTHRHGSSRVDHVEVLKLPQAEQKGLERYVQDGRIVGLVSWAERRTLAATERFAVIERVRFGVTGEDDPETDLHSDIFFPTHKLWLYLGDVTGGTGPLVYVPKSHRLSLPRIRWEYRNSIGNGELSRRISLDELSDLNLRETTLTCPANTLVVANTCGYHRRTAAVAGAERLAFHMSFRFNPFLPGSWAIKRSIGIGL